MSISRAPWCGGLGGGEEDGGAGSTNSTTIPIDLDDFSRFVHRGLDAEGIDAKETERLYARCLRGRDGSRRAVSDVLDADHLERVVRDGEWDKHWAKFVSEARQKAAERGVSAAAMAVFGATASDPIRAGVVPGLSSPSRRNTTRSPATTIGTTRNRRARPRWRAPRRSRAIISCSSSGS